MENVCYLSEKKTYIVTVTEAGGYPRSPPQNHGLAPPLPPGNGVAPLEQPQLPHALPRCSVLGHGYPDCGINSL